VAVVVAAAAANSLSRLCSPRDKRNGQITKKPSTEKIFTLCLREVFDARFLKVGR